MPPASPTQNAVSGSATAATTCATGTLTKTANNKAWIYVWIAYNGDYTTGPVTSVTYGADPGQFIAAQVSVLTNVSIELWAVPFATVTSDVVTANFTGASYTIVVAAVEAHLVGVAGAPASTTAGFASVAGSVTGSVTSGDSLGGRKSTILVPVANNMVMAMGAVVGASTSMSLTVGTALLVPVTAGAAANQIKAGVAWVQATGGADTITWTRTLGSEWVMLAADIAGAALVEFPIRAGGVIPVPF